MPYSLKRRFNQLIYGTVEAHTPFGVFVDIGDSHVKGIIQITDFLDQGRMTPEMYPDIGSPVGAIVVGYTEDERQQIWLSVKPSILQKSLIKLKIPASAINKTLINIHHKCQGIILKFFDPTVEQV